MLNKTKWFVNATSILCLLCASALPFRTCRLGQDRLNDDTYITLCYAKNLAAGNGFVYNHGPPTLGTTTPLFAMMVAGVSRFLPVYDIASVAMCLTALLWALLPWIVVGFRRVFDLQVWEAVIVGLFVLAFKQPNIGAESIPFQVLLLSAVALFAGRRYWTAGFAVGLLALCRGEGMLLVPVFGILHCLREMQAMGWGMASLRSPKRGLMRLNPLIRMSLGVAVPVLVWAIYAQATFGYVIPQTLWIKMQQGEELSFRSQFLGELLKHMQRWVVLDLPRLQGLLFLQWAMVAVGLWNVIARRRGWTPYVLWCISYIGAYTAFGVPGWFWWYRIPAYWCWTVLCALGLSSCIRFVCRTLRKWIQGRDVFVGGATTALVFAAVMYDAGTAEGPVRDRRADVHLRICEWMNENTDPSASLAAVEVGYFGYFTSNRIIDRTGLIMPRESGYARSRGWEKTLSHHKPDYYVRVAKDGAKIKHPAYARVKVFRSRHADNYVLYKRRANGKLRRKKGHIFEGRDRAGARAS